jgi:hypothetical protein
MTRCRQQAAPAPRRPRKGEGWGEGVGNYSKWSPSTPALSAVGIAVGPPRGSASCTECLVRTRSVKWKPPIRPKAL